MSDSYKMEHLPPIFPSVDSIVNYLRESSPSEVVLSSTTLSTVDSTKVNTSSKPGRKRKKEKELVQILHSESMPSKDVIQVLPSGRVRYGPITVNPRKIPAKTLFTGRRSKYEQLTVDEEEKRRLRRERNRLAATKCREKRDTVLAELELIFQQEDAKYRHLMGMVQTLQAHKNNLENILSNKIHHERLQPIEPVISVEQPQTTVLGETGFVSSIIEPSVPLISSTGPQFIQNNEHNLNNTVEPTISLLTNTTFDNDQLSFLLNPEQQNQQTISMNSSSLERLINSLQTPAPTIDNNNNNCSGLYNSAYGSSSCAQQHSSSSEDDSLPPNHKNYYVF